MNLDRVTITGADDSIHPQELIRLSTLFPFAEWGILLSKSQVGHPRFPSFGWLRQLQAERTINMQLSEHICGTWVRNMMAGSCLFQHDMYPYLGMFKRLQWNFHAEHLRPQLGCVATGLLYYPNHQHIFQMDGVNDQLLSTLRTSQEADIVPLFDTSGGAGIVPKKWPAAMPDVYCGYAGGLGPDTLEHEITRIKEVVGHATIWIGMERRVRSDNDHQFDLQKVERCLRIANKWVTV